MSLQSYFSVLIVLSLTPLAPISYDVGSLDCTKFEPAPENSLCTVSITLPAVDLVAPTTPWLKSGHYALHSPRSFVCPLSGYKVREANKKL